MEGGEQLGVTRTPMLGDKLLAWAGERGGWSGGGMVGVMPGMLRCLDINWVGGWERFSSTYKCVVCRYQNQLYSVASQGFPENLVSSFRSLIHLLKVNPAPCHWLGD